MTTWIYLFIMKNLQKSIMQLPTPPELRDILDLLYLGLLSLLWLLVICPQRAAYIKKYFNMPTVNHLLSTVS